jgi:hypothetical protein
MDGRCVTCIVTADRPIEQEFYRACARAAGPGKLKRYRRSSPGLREGMDIRRLNLK